MSSVGRKTPPIGATSIGSAGASGSSTSASPQGGQVVPLRRLHERRVALSDISDEALVAACGVGEDAALGALFDRHHAAVFRVVSRMLRCEPTEIDDLVQTTFLEAWRSAKRFRGGGASVKSWLFGIAANLVRHYVRGERRRRDAFAAIPEPAAAHGPDISAIRAQQMDRLARALDKLGHDLKVAYVMCDLEDVAGVDAAAALGVRPGTLWRRLHEARRALREAIDEGGAR